MKKIFLLLLMLPFAFSCSDDGDDNAPKNALIGTKWTTTDDIAEMLYGKTCTTTIEFLDNSNCQTIDIRKGMNYGSGTFITPGTYTIKQDSVFWTEEGSDNTMKGKISGSTITTTMRLVNMSGYRVYIKE
ncbi:MAG: hypothetical protein LBP83_05040 [Dysgonamonadaceae bacterium]|jgi:hypothetical protein|nr:hypothetical protein [Dysgonamonadaceae bacterium]